MNATATAEAAIKTETVDGLTFAVETYTPPAPAEPAHTELVRKLIALGDDKQAAFRYSNEEDALSALKSWQGAARFLNVGVKRVSLDAEGKGKDAVVVLRVKIGPRTTRKRNADAPAETAPQQGTETAPAETTPAEPADVATDKPGK